MIADTSVSPSRSVHVSQNSNNNIKTTTPTISQTFADLFFIYLRTESCNQCKICVNEYLLNSHRIKSQMAGIFMPYKENNTIAIIVWSTQETNYKELKISLWKIKL